MNYFFRSSRVYVVAFFFCLFLAQQSHAEEFDSTSLRNDSQFLTIFLHGLNEDVSDQKLNVDGFYGATDSHYDNTIAERTELGQTNLFYYNFSNMANYNSLTFIREIGDFNSGTMSITTATKL